MSNVVKSLTEKLNAAKIVAAQLEALTSLQKIAKDTGEQHRARFPGIDNEFARTSHADWTAKSHAAEALANEIRNAQATVQEIEPLVNSVKNAKQAFIEFDSQKAASAKASEHLARANRMISELTGEISVLESKMSDATTKHGAECANARLNGLPEPNTPIAISKLSSDLQSRRTTLVSAQMILAKAESDYETENAALESARGRYRTAHHYSTELTRLEFIAEHAVTLAKLAVASGKPRVVFDLDKGLYNKIVSDLEADFA
jgi:DNA repair exonuclease SbcCD ATPase subunit